MRRDRGQQGFTLIEIISVLVILEIALYVMEEYLVRYQIIVKYQRRGCSRKWDIFLCIQYKLINTIY